MEGRGGAERTDVYRGKYRMIGKDQRRGTEQRYRRGGGADFEIRCQLNHATWPVIFCVNAHCSCDGSVRIELNYVSCDGFRNFASLCINKCII